MSLFLAATSIIPDDSVEFTATLIIAGISVVLGILALLIFVVKIYGLIVSKSEGVFMRKNKKKSNTASPQLDVVATPPPAPSKPAAPAAQGVSDEVIAAISAAVYMMEGEGAVVRSVTPARTQTPNPITRRNPWAFAAISDNTRPF